MTEKITIRTIERGIRVAPTNEIELTPEKHIKQQLQSFLLHSEHEKKDMNKLNDQMSSYVGRVKALENENVKLLRDLQELKRTWGSETREIRTQFDGDLYDVRTRIDDTANLKAIADVKLKRLQSEINEYQGRLETLEKFREDDHYKILDLERELEQTKSSLDTLDSSINEENADIDKYREQRDHLWNQMVDLLDNLDSELLNRLSIEHTNQTLRENIEFSNAIHERQVAEMFHLQNALPVNDQIEFYKDQLKKVIKNIRRDYEQLSEEQSREMQEWMNMKTEELASKYKERDLAHDLELDILTENKENLNEQLHLNNKEIGGLRREQEDLAKRLAEMEEFLDFERKKLGETLEKQDDIVAKLNDDISNLLNDYNHLNVNKSNLEYEINVYRRLLDSQLKHLSKASTEVKDVNTASVSTGAFGGKVQNKKEKKGPIGIDDATPDGRFVLLDNVSETSIDLSGWSIKRKVDNNQDLVYVFPKGTNIQAQKTLKVWAGLFKDQLQNDDLINTNTDSWGIGVVTITRLYNTNSEEKSRFHQQITFGDYN